MLGTAFIGKCVNYITYAVDRLIAFDTHLHVNNATRYQLLSASFEIHLPSGMLDKIR